MKLIRKFKFWLFNGNKCDCGGIIKHDHTEWTGNVWIEVYECKQCHRQYV